MQNSHSLLRSSFFLRLLNWAGAGLELHIYGGDLDEVPLMKLSSSPFSVTCPLNEQKTVSQNIGCLTAKKKALKSSKRDETSQTNVLPRVTFQQTSGQQMHPTCVPTFKHSSIIL